MEHEDLNIGYDDDPLAEIMREAEEAGVVSSNVRSRYLNFGGASGRYTSFKKKSKAQVAELDDEKLTEYKQRLAIEEPIADRGTVKALILYMTQDMGKAFWPNGKDFVGQNFLCQSERSAPPYDTALMNPRIDPTHKGILKKAGHTGQCSTCPLAGMNGSDNKPLCGPRLIAYLVDIDHVKQVNAYNAANPGADVPLTFTKLDAKGPQSYWNFKACYGKLIAEAKKKGRSLSDFVVELTAEPGNLGSKKVTFEIVETLDADSPLRPIAKFLAREALDASKVIRKPFSAALPPAKQFGALPAEKTTADEFVVDVEEIPF